MIKVMDQTANEALSNMTRKLARDAVAGPAYRKALREYLDALDAPFTYANEDIERSGYLAELLQKLMTK